MRIHLAILLSTALIVGCEEAPEVRVVGGSIEGVEYVNVRYEPQHRHEFENDDIRIYDVLLPPEYVTLYHAHVVDTIYVVVSGSKLKTRSLTGSSLPIALPVPSGTVLFNEHTKEPLVHEVTNEGDNAARLLGVELKFERTEFARQPLSASGLELDATYAKARVYELNLEPGESTGKLEIDFAALMIAKTEASVTFSSTNQPTRIASLEPASWEWLDHPGIVTITNIGLSPYEAVLYELP